MSLLVPLALLGLLTLPVIILMHFLRTRREPLLIWNLLLWQGLEQKRQSTRLRYLPLSLMLVLQLCLAAALSLALARPALSFLFRSPQRTIFILDTTTSMLTEDAGPLANTRRFEIARQAIQTYLQTINSSDAFTVIGLNRRPEVLLSGEAEQAGQALLALEKITPGATGLDLPAALTLAGGLLDTTRQNQIIVLTDGAYSVDADTLPHLPLAVTWQFIPAQPNTDNQALLNVSAQTWPDGRHRLFARVVNYGPSPVQRTLRLLIDNQAVDETSVQLDPQSEVARAWTLPPAAQTAEIEIVESDALPIDNQAGVFLSGAISYRVLLVSDLPEAQDSALARALSAQPGVELTIANSTDLNRYNSADFSLTVFDGLPPTLTAWPPGNVLAVNPSPDQPLLPAAGTPLDARPNSVTASSLLAGLDLSGVYFEQVAPRALPAWAKADLTSIPLTGTMSAANGETPLIFHGTVAQSQVVVWAFDLAKSNLGGRLALPLLTANTITLLRSTLPPPIVALGEPVRLDAHLSVELPGGPRLTQPAGEEDEMFALTKLPGLYKIYNQTDRLVGGFAVQAGSALESNLSLRFQPDTLTASVADTSQASRPADYRELWPWLAGLVLVVVTVEGWLAWRK